MERLKQSYKVDFDNIDVSGKLSINAISRYMQELAAKDASRLGISFLDGENVPQAYWILSRVKYDIQRYPVCNEDITMETYPAGCDKLFLVRCFEIKDKNEQMIGKITANYLLMDTKRNRPIKLSPNTEELAQFDYLYDGEKVAKVSGVTLPVREELRKAYYSEIDYNGHMNNSHYIRWSVDMLTEELVKGREIKSIEINYNAPIMCNSEVRLMVQDIEGGYLISGQNVISGKNYFNTEIIIFER